MPLAERASRAHSDTYPGDDFDVVKYDGSAVPYGTVHHDQQQITNSRYAKDGESVSRAGGVSNDMIGKALVVSTTATYSDGQDRLWGDQDVQLRQAW